MLAIAYFHAGQIDTSSFTVANLLAQPSVLLESIASLESLGGREWLSYPRYAAVDHTEAVQVGSDQTSAPQVHALAATPFADERATTSRQVAGKG